MSYPQLLCSKRQNEDFVIFTIPSKEVIHKIIRDSTQDIRLHTRVAANILYIRVSELTFLLSTYNAEIVSQYSKNTVQFRLSIELMQVKPREDQEAALKTRSPRAARERRSPLASIVEERID
jgi:hypothetical protein